MTTTTCPACGQNLLWSDRGDHGHWVHTSILATLHCPDITASDSLPAPASTTSAR